MSLKKNINKLFDVTLRKITIIKKKYNGTFDKEYNDLYIISMFILMDVCEKLRADVNEELSRFEYRIKRSEQDEMAQNE